MSEPFLKNIPVYRRTNLEDLISGKVPVLSPDGSFEEYTDNCPYCNSRFKHFAYYKHGTAIYCICTDCGVNLGARKQYHDLTEWGKYIRHRAGNRCEMCGEFSDRLHAHHLKPRKYFENDQFNLRNGIALCKKCHVLIHGNKNKTEKE